jgi:hypothetical protein
LGGLELAESTPRLRVDCGVIQNQPSKAVTELSSQDVMRVCCRRHPARVVRTVMRSIMMRSGINDKGPLDHRMGAVTAGGYLWLTLTENPGVAQAHEGGYIPPP